MPIPLPDLAGRQQILAIHLRKAREAGLVSPAVDDASLASKTGSFSGADLAGLVRSATSFAIADWRQKQAEEEELAVDGSQGGAEGGGGSREGEKRGAVGAGLLITVDNFERAMVEVAMTSGRGGGERGRIGMLGSRLRKVSEFAARRMSARE